MKLHKTRSLCVFRPGPRTAPCKRQGPNRSWVKDECPRATYCHLGVRHGAYHTIATSRKTENPNAFPVSQDKVQAFTMARRTSPALDPVHLSYCCSSPHFTLYKSCISCCNLSTPRSFTRPCLAIRCPFAWDVPITTKPALCRRHPQCTAD